MKKIFNRENTTASILGTEYEIIFKSYDDEPEFSHRNAAALCNTATKVILVCIIESEPGYTKCSEEHLSMLYREIIRHEIIHAFLYESGLDGESHSNSSSWATDEEIIDWFAIQFPKIKKVYEKLDLI